MTKLGHVIHKTRPVQSLGEFVDRVSECRQLWGLAKHKELWFRGESRDYGETSLRPELYRPESRKNLPARAEAKLSSKTISKLLNIESDLYEEFQRNAVLRSDAKTFEKDWDWDSYFLMQHHSGPTRLLDWSDGALMALHFALRNNKDDSHNARVYVLEAYRFNDDLSGPAEIRIERKWRKYVAKHPLPGRNADEWEDAYLPLDEETRKEMKVPRPPLVLDFPLITPRIAAQRSRFIVFGTEPSCLFDEFRKRDSAIKLIEIAAGSRSKIRQELRDCGVTESVIYPDLDGLGREMKQLWDDRRGLPKKIARSKV
jgi:hypothetical protein